MDDSTIGDPELLVAIDVKYINTKGGARPNGRYLNFIKCEQLINHFNN